jgi:glycosyltransferase involved in cell wall biosynthesis
VRLIAVSETIRQALIDAGVDPHAVMRVFNGMDTGHFLDQLATVRRERVFVQVRARNHVPQRGPVVLLSARRAPWQGHFGLIDAVHRLHTNGDLGETVVLINGAGLLDTRTPSSSRN